MAFTKRQTVFASWPIWHVNREIFKTSWNVEILENIPRKNEYGWRLTLYLCNCPAILYLVDVAITSASSIVNLLLSVECPSPNSEKIIRIWLIHFLSWRPNQDELFMNFVRLEVLYAVTEKKHSLSTCIHRWPPGGYYHSQYFYVDSAVTHNFCAISAPSTNGVFRFSVPGGASIQVQGQIPISFLRSSSKTHKPVVGCKSKAWT